MTGNELVLQIFNGMTFGALLFLLASGFTLIFGLMNIMNLAHGGFYLIGGYVGLSVMLATRNFILAVLAGATAIAIVGMVVERGLLRRIRGQANPEVLLTVGLTFAFGDIALAIWSGDPRPIPNPPELSGSLNLLGLTYPTFRVAVVAFAAIVALTLWYLQEHTRFGAIIRAGVDDREMVDALGIDIGRVFTQVFAFGAFLAGIAGVLGGVFMTLYPGADWEIFLFALVVVIIGGPGSLGGAVLGSLIVGLIDSFAKVLVPDLVYFTVFAPMALILVWRPSGLFGRQS